MAKLTITKARKILGNLTDNISDEEIEKDIQAAEMLKNLFFNHYLGQKSLQSVYNESSNGKA